MRKIMLLLLCPVVLSGCGKRDVEACELSIKAQLKAPATYKRIEITRVDSDNLTIDEFNKEAGIPKPQTELDRSIELVNASRAKGKNLALRELMVSYDADNAYGTPMRSTAICAFRLLDGELEDKESLKSSASRVSLRQGQELLAELQGKPAPPRPRYDCCL